MELEKLFWDIDDFCQEFLPIFEERMISHKLKKRNRKTRLALSEIMTVIIHFHQSHYRNFKLIKNIFASLANQIFLT